MRDCTAVWRRARPGRDARGEPLLLSSWLGGWRGLSCRNDTDNSSGFDVAEHFRESEVLSQDDHDFFLLFSFGAVRRIGVHLFRFRLFGGLVCRGSSPPFASASVSGRWVLSGAVAVESAGVVPEAAADPQA